MPNRKRNIFLKILIILISLVLFGFQNVPVNVDPGPAKADEWEPNGYVDLLLYGQASAGSGASSLNCIWNPVHVYLPFTHLDSRGNAVFRGGAFTFAQGNARQGPITVLAGWPVYWKVKGHVTPPPECAIEMKIDETWFPGYKIGCEPTGIVGCITEMWKPDFIPGAKFKIPFDRAWGVSGSGVTFLGTPRHITVIVEQLSLGDTTGYIGGKAPLGCEYHLYFPVIPQAEE